jgi:trigger factor
MQVSIETTSNLERRLTVGVPAERVEVEIDSRLKRAAQKAKLPGFRPGKVPLKVMRQRYGAGVRQEVLGEVVSQSFQEAVVQEKLRPAGQPSIEPKSLEAGKDLQYVAVFEVFPDIDLVDMKDFPVMKPVAQVKDDDVNNIIEVFRKQQGTWEEVKRAAVMTDKVNLNYTGLKGDEEFEGGSAKDSDLELGSGRMINGFEEGIVGMLPEEQKTLELRFPDDYHNAELQGASVTFDVTLNKISELVPAAIDEELFAKYGVKEGGEERFRQDVSANMARELSNAVEANVKQQVMDALLQTHEALEVPKALVDQEISAMRQQMFQQFGGAGSMDLDLESLLPDTMFLENAERRVKLGLILAEYISNYELKADDERVTKAIEEIASTYESPQEVMDYYQSNPQQRTSVESKVLEDQVVEKLLAGANVTESQKSYHDVVGADKADA